MQIGLPVNIADDLRKNFTAPAVLLRKLLLKNYQREVFLLCSSVGPLVPVNRSLGTNFGYFGYVYNVLRKEAVSGAHAAVRGGAAAVSQ